MPAFCAAPNCSAKRSEDTARKGITFHGFPKDPLRRRKWVSALGYRTTDGKLWEPTKNNWLCSKHFKPEMFDRTGQTVRLRDFAVPTEFNVPDYLKVGKSNHSELQQERAAEGVPFVTHEAHLKGDSIKKQSEKMVGTLSTETSCQKLGDGQSGIGDLVLAAELVETANDTVCHIQKEAWTRQVTGHDHGSYAIPEDLLVLKEMVRELKETVYQQTQGLSALQSTLTLKNEQYQEMKERAEDEKCHLSVELGQQISELEAENINLRFQKASLDKMVQSLKEQMDSSAGAVLFMSQQLKEKQIRMKEAAFTMENIKEDKKWVRFYTGFDSYERFQAFLEFVTGDAELCAGKIRGHFSKGKIDVGPNTTLSHEDQLLLVLVRLRLGLLLQDLAFRFRVSESTASRIWLNWTEVMHARLLQIPIIYSQKYVDSFQPKRVIHHQGITLTILDCTDLFFEVHAKDRTKLANTRPCRNHYIRHGYAIASPNGFMTFSSSLPFGIAARVGEEHITSGDEECESDQGVSTLSLPPFLQNIPVLLPPEQQDLVQQVLSVKSLVDKVLNYRFLKHVYTQSMEVQVDRAWTVCCYLACMLHEPMGLQ